MMRKYLAAGALGASLLGVGVATAPLASAHGAHDGGGRAGDRQEVAVEQSRDWRDGGRGTDDRDGREARGGGWGDGGRVSDRGDGRNCDDEGAPPTTTVPGTDPEPGTGSDNGTGSGVDPGDGAPVEVGYGNDPWQVLSELLDMSRDEIRADLRAGLSIDDMAAARGLEPGAVQDALTWNFDQKVDRLVAEGRLSAEQGEQLKAQLDTVVSIITAIRLTPAPAATPAA